MFLCWGESDLSIAFSTHPGSQATSQVETKDSTLLSSRDGYLLEPTEWPKGTQASYGVWREDSGLLSRPFREEKTLISRRLGSLVVFLELRCQCGVSHGVRQGAQGDFLVAPGKSGLHARGEQE